MSLTLFLSFCLLHNRMASRAAKAKATAYKDLDSNDEEEDEEDDILESDEDN